MQKMHQGQIVKIIPSFLDRCDRSSIRTLVVARIDQHYFEVHYFDEVQKNDLS
jgi:hypothetical protein